MSSNASFVCFGEVLWDIFHDAKHLGGAPLNVALRLASLCDSNSVSIISALGRDRLAEQALSVIKRTTLRADLIQSNQYPTGSVQVSLSHSGNATYQITDEVAWDFIKATPAAIDSLKGDTVFIYGSLAARTKESREALVTLVQAAHFTVFDVNLRPPYFIWEDLIQLLKSSSFIKMNDEELSLICEQMGCHESSLEAQLKWLQVQTAAQYLCVTLGARGACILHQDEFVKVRGTPVKVVDTVGAGDSFLATLLWTLFYERQTIKEALTKACLMGALVASSAGANPVIPLKDLEQLFKNSGNN